MQVIVSKKINTKLVEDLNPSVENCFPYTSHIYLFLVLGGKGNDKNNKNDCDFS